MSREIDAWVEATGCVEPISQYKRSTLERYESRIVVALQLRGSDGKHLIGHLWKKTDNAFAIAWGIGAAIVNKKYDLGYVIACSRNAPNIEKESATDSEKIAEPAEVAPVVQTIACAPDSSAQMHGYEDPLGNYCFFNRRLRYHPFLKTVPDWVRVMWDNLIMDAAWREHEVEWRGRKIMLQRGQWIISEREIARERGQSPRMVHYWIKKFVEHQMIQCVTVFSKVGDSGPWSVAGCVAGNVAGCVAGGTLVTLCNYDKFQPDISSVVAGCVAGSVAGSVAQQKNVLTEEGIQKNGTNGLGAEKQAKLTAKKLFEIWNRECNPLTPVEAQIPSMVSDLLEHINQHQNNGRGPEDHWIDLIHLCRECHPSHRSIMSPAWLSKDLEHVNQVLRGVYNRKFGEQGEPNVKPTVRTQASLKGSRELFKGQSFKP